MYCVYKHTAPNGKVYIGITSKNPIDRWQNGHGYKNNPHFWNAIIKFGWDNFKHEILFSNLSKEEAEQKEIELIARYKSNKHKYGYNRAAGGHSNNGYKHTKETKFKIANSLMGHSVSEHCRKQNGVKHRKLWENQDYRQRLSEAHKGTFVGKKSPCAKPINQYTMDGIFIQQFDCMKDVERQLKIDRRLVGACCSGRQRSAKGYKWAYVGGGE